MNSTGAGSGIGRAACKLLARDGAIIIAADKNLAASQETQEMMSNDSLALAMDVTSSESVTTGLKVILDEFNAPPTIIVNAAGITKDNFIFNMSESEFDDVINVNLKVNIIMITYLNLNLI